MRSDSFRQSIQTSRILTKGLTTKCQEKKYYEIKVDLPVPPIHSMRIIIKFKAVRFSRVIVIYAHSFKYAVQNTSPIGATVNFFAHLGKGKSWWNQETGKDRNYQARNVNWMTSIKRWVHPSKPSSCKLKLQAYQ